MFIDADVLIIEPPLIPVMRGKIKRERLDVGHIGNILEYFQLKGNTAVFMEELWGFGSVEKQEQKQWDFATSYGIYLGCISTAKLSLTLVPPQTWQKAVGKRGSEKIYSIERAIQLFPGVKLNREGARKPHDGNAEALLIAHYGRLQVGDAYDYVVGIDPGFKGGIAVLKTRRSAA